MTQKAKNTSLNRASQAKEDEFYTQLEDIENELRHYRHHFKDKVVFLNCDDPETSNFWRYFQLNFDFLGLKKLISTHFDPEKPTYKLELSHGDKEPVKTPLTQNGDFRSPECIEILKQSDIICTNPPFSLFREYIAQLFEYNKKFLVIGSQNNATYKDIFPLIQNNELWLGYKSGDMAFRVPDYYEPRKTRYWVDETGQKWRSMGNITWYTNLSHNKRNEELLLVKYYNETDYPQYSNYDSIEVGRVADIPKNYYGKMGVPVTFLSSYNPNQFEIIGYSGTLAQPIYIDGKKKSGRFYIGTRRLYERLVIKRKEKNNGNTTS